MSTVVAMMVGFWEEVDMNEDPVSCRVLIRASSRWSARERLAPRAKRALAAARPMPEVEPVMEMTLLASEIIVLSNLWRRELR